MTRQPLSHPKRIIQDPAILAGKPVVKGTRISVEVILECLAHNPDFVALFADYPRLTMDDVKASRAISSKHRRSIVTVHGKQRLRQPLLGESS